jgi:hypothetical protein
MALPWACNAQPEAGLGDVIASIKREGLRSEFKIPEKYEILLILALGKPV